MFYNYNYINNFKLNSIEDIYDIFFNSTLNLKSYSKSPKMHYMKRTLQAEGWDGDYNVFLKRDFYFDFYMIEKENIPNDEFEAKEFIKLNLDKYIISKNPQNVFTTKLMDKDTEDNLSLKKNIKSVKVIETNFDKYIKRKKIKETTSNPYIIKLPDEPTEYIANYFLLQKTRSTYQMLYLVRDFLKDVKINKNVAYYFRKIYNKKISEIFYTYYSQTYKENSKIHIRQVRINSPTLKIKNIVTIGEINCINLSLYNSQINIFNEYEQYLKDIDVAAISGDTIYVLIRDYNPIKDEDYISIINLIAKSWNSFTFHTSYQYIVCPSSGNFKEYLSDMIYDVHIYNYFEKQMSPIMEKLIEIESFIK